MSFIYWAIGLYALSFGLFATGHVAGGILCIVIATLLVMAASEKVPTPEPPRRLVTSDNENAGWQEVMAEVSTHVAITGCLCTQADFTDPTGECPYGGTYAEHPAK